MEVIEAQAGNFVRPKIQLDILETGWAPWKHKFKRHHYLLDAGPMSFATAFTGFVDKEAVCFIGISGMVVGKGIREARVCRMVTVPEWQGAGVGMAFLEWVCERELRGDGFIGKPTTTIMHSAHPALVVSLLRNPKWRAIKGSQRLHGGRGDSATGMGGHLRAVAGFRYYGQRGIDAAEKKKGASRGSTR